MKNRKRRSEPAARPAPKTDGLKRWHLLAFAGAVLISGLIAYAPAIKGEFVFDDLYLPFQAEEFASAPLRHWMAGVRPVLMFSFWLDRTLWGTEPGPYHVVNVFLHAAASLLVFAIARRILGRVGEAGMRRDGLAALACGIFLLHPLQTEAVAYVASRSEVLSVALAYAALAVFLYWRRDAIGWPAGLATVALFGAAVTTKEHAAALPAVMLLADYYFFPGFKVRGILRNWRLYALIAAAGAAAGVMISNVLRFTDTAGLRLKEVTWLEYFYTQGRAIWLYLRLFVLPFGQNIDHDMPYSRSPFDGGAAFGLAALAGLAVAAIVWRKRFPLASFGYLTMLVLLAPTSSFMPIVDPVAERRMYLPFIGLMFVVMEAARRVPVRGRVLAGAGGAALAALFLLTSARSQVWSNGYALWKDTVEKSPRKFRPLFQFAHANFTMGRCGEALRYYEAAGKAPGAHPNARYSMLLNWGLAYDCAGDQAEAIEKVREAAAILRTAHAYATMGMLYNKQGKVKEALAALDTAVQLDPNFYAAYLYRGNVYLTHNQFEEAVAAYRQALALKPGDGIAAEALAYAEAKRKGAQ